MIKKILGSFFVFALVLGALGLLQAPVAEAQVSSLPSGCTSTMGNSTTTGQPCNGTSTASTSFPSGCTSVIGYSTTNGLACNGTFTATTTFFPGCTSVIGYSTFTGFPCNGGVFATTTFFPGCTSTLGTSTFTGLPCSGGLVALPFLAGCTSVFGFSTITGQPCNGTFSATFDTGGVIVTDPGLPTTGAGGNAFANVLALLSSGGMMVLGSIFLARRKSRAN